MKDAHQSNRLEWHRPQSSSLDLCTFSDLCISMDVKNRFRKSTPEARLINRGFPTSMGAHKTYANMRPPLTFVRVVRSNRPLYSCCLHVDMRFAICISDISMTWHIYLLRSLRFCFVDGVRSRVKSIRVHKGDDACAQRVECVYE